MFRLNSKATTGNLINIDRRNMKNDTINRDKSE